MIRKLQFSIILLLVSRELPAQPISALTLEQCYSLAASNSPMYQQKALTIAAGNKLEKNVGLNWLPRLDIGAQATYQSDVTSVPIKVPNITIEELDKDQYKATLELVQPVFDGGIIAGQKKLQQINTATEAQKVAVDLYQLRSNINNFYFNALLMDQNMAVTKLIQEDLNNSIQTVAAQVSNGIATKSNADMLKAELLKTAQRMIDFRSFKKQALEILAILTGAEINEQTIITKPSASINMKDTVVKRPELKLFDFQQQNFQQQSKLINAKTSPKLSLFANGGYGKPGLNMLRNEFQWFYLTGLKINFPLMSRITQHNDMAVLKIQEQVVGKQRENFLINNRQLLTRQKNEIERYQQLMSTDAEIIALRKSIKENAYVKLSNGIITTSDYIVELNSENQAMLGQKLHEVGLLEAYYNYKIIKGE